MFRVVFYLLGAIMALALAGMFWATRDQLARMFAGMMVVWAFNSALLLATLLSLETGLSVEWRPLAFSVDAIVLGVSPLMLYVYWTRQRSEK